MATTQKELLDRTYTFFLSKGSQDQSRILQEVPFDLFDNLTRQRRSGQKSRAGCENCKQRRVKVLLYSVNPASPLRLTPG